MKRITIFGREGCGFCKRAVELCKIKNLDYRYIDIHVEGISKADLEKTVGKPVETVPQIFCGQEHIGGYTEFAAYIEEALSESA
ncbi:GrxA family glutaredoxin [Marinobacterium sp. YM272]|uniref:GrxA family glutaredoxin n=1 Tax=Marinobacterium sp. YM272 TaxID=3421654 RepID=UPI003D7F20FC